MDINLHNEYTDNRKDSITSLLNFACTRELIIDYIAPGDAQGILLLIDIDNLKFLNEMLGFYFGDQVISSVALRGVRRRVPHGACRSAPHER